MAERPDRAGSAVELREVDAANVRAVCELTLAPGQEPYVAPAAFTIAEAAYEPEGMLRAIYPAGGGKPVGVLFVDLAAAPASPLLVRLQIDAAHQRRGYGAATVAVLAEELRERGRRELRTSYHRGALEPRDFYLGLGFEPTGEVEDGEPILSLDLGYSGSSNARSASSR